MRILRPIVLSAMVLLSSCGDSAVAPAAMPDAAPMEPDAAPPAPIFMVDVFASAGHVLRFDVNPTQATEMESATGSNPFEDEYQIPGLGTFADNLNVTDALSGLSHDFGKIELAIVGQSTRRPWKRIPSLRLDMDQFTKGQRLGNEEYLRLNNGQVSGVYREGVALSMWRFLGYPAPRSTFAWVEAPGQWGQGIRVPYTVTEVYKRKWCDTAMAPNKCENIWESVGDIASLASQCQVAQCDDTRLLQFAAKLQQTQPGPGFEQAMSEFVDWDEYRKFQCTSWITGTGDDYVHNNNNIVLAERSDGKMQLLPYSVDISAGQQWYPDVKLMGQSQLSNGCQLDPGCWQAMLSQCDQLLTKFETGNVVETIVNPVVKDLDDAGMQRPGDDRRAQQLRDWYNARAAQLRADPVWQSIPCVDNSTCANNPNGQTSCQGVCVSEGGDGQSCGGIICFPGSFCQNNQCVRFFE
jgi:hypothetical protein